MTTGVAIPPGFEVVDLGQVGACYRYEVTALGQTCLIDSPIELVEKYPNQRAKDLEHGLEYFRYRLRGER